jgi:hypothetical protein
MEDLVQQLAATPSTLAHLVVEASDEQLDQAPVGEWSARTILAHLRDDEFLVLRMRCERMLSEENPTFPDFDEKAWAASRNRARDRKEELLGDFALQRQASLNMLANLRPSDEHRGGRHAEYGPFTVRSWVEHWVEHDDTHVAQIERMLGETLAGVLERRARRDAD